MSLFHDSLSSTFVLTSMSQKQRVYEIEFSILTRDLHVAFLILSSCLGHFAQLFTILKSGLQIASLRDPSSPGNL